MIDHACLLPQTQFQTSTASGLRYLPNDIPHSSIYKDFSDAFVDQYFHPPPAVLEVCRLDCGESISVISNSQFVPVAQRDLKFDVERHESGRPQFLVGVCSGQCGPGTCLPAQLGYLVNRSSLQSQTVL